MVNTIMNGKQFKTLVQRAKMTTNKANPFMHFDWSGVRLTISTTNGRMFLAQQVAGTGDASITLPISALDALTDDLPPTQKELSGVSVRFQLVGQDNLAVYVGNEAHMLKHRGYVEFPDWTVVQSKASKATLKTMELGILAKLSKGDCNPITLHGGGGGPVVFLSEHYYGLIQH